ncbi:MAG: hypothetical protein JWO53_493 [Chlamydiia bacterium]|nr:hypothetical protein [Chlamydiia bacterium]
MNPVAASLSRSSDRAESIPVEQKQSGGNPQSERTDQIAQSCIRLSSSSSDPEVAKDFKRFGLNSTRSFFSPPSTTNGGYKQTEPLCYLPAKLPLDEAVKEATLQQGEFTFPENLKKEAEKAIRLDLSKATISPKVVSLIVKYCPKLQYVNCSNTDITMEQLGILLLLKELKNIIVVNCPNIKTEAIQELRKLYSNIDIVLSYRL